jgi:hypothetical protein
MFDRWLGLWRNPAATAPPMAKSATATPFCVVCRCGHVLEGMRQHRRQILTCPKCGRKVFVLPASPWPRPGQKLDAALQRLETRGSKTEGKKAWRQPVRAAVITILLMGLIVVAVLMHLESSANRSRTQFIREQADLGRAALDRGSLAEAHLALAQVSDELQRLPKDFPHREGSELRRLCRQVNLANSLLTSSLEELVEEAKQTPTEKWNANFATKYAGKAVVFDAHILPQKDRHIQLEYALRVDGEPGLIEISDLEELPEWVSPHQESQRWMFGVRLAEIGLKNTAETPEGQWTIRFQKESVELVTEPKLLRILDLPDQPDVRNVLANQRRLVGWQQPQRPNAADIRVGEPSELIRNRFGPPTRIARQILAGRYLEQWIYSQAQPFVVHFEHRKGTDFRVVWSEQQLPNLQK